jgi:hypothetical protein
MGAGLALWIRNEYPVVYNEYRIHVHSGKVLGTVQIVRINNDLHIANVFGQEAIKKHFRQVCTDYDAVDSAFKQLKEYVVNNNLDIKKVFIPYKMGCGLGGGNWYIYIQTVLQYFPEINVIRYNGEFSIV